MRRRLLAGLATFGPRRDAQPGKKRHRGFSHDLPRSESELFSFEFISVGVWSFLQQMFIQGHIKGHSTYARFHKHVMRITWALAK